MELEIILIFLAIVAFIAIYLIKKRGLVGAMIGGKVEKTYGEVAGTAMKLLSAKIKVHKLNKKGKSKVVVEFVATSPASWQSMPIELDKNQVSKLRGYLENAENEI